MSSLERKCPRCAAALLPSARFCPACGLALARLTPGEVLDGKYEIVDKIAEGGMGEVYRARHLHLDEIRIIKVGKPGALGEDVDVRRFQEEARLATLVRHPNVAALYDFSRQTDGGYYMVWEFIDGVTLEARLARQGPLPLVPALEVALQILAGLGEIHAQGIVHRDLSPDNIMLREGADGRFHAKIIDLGIAKRVSEGSLQMTRTGMFVGKLKYCSPEQAGALPEGQAVDGRSDLYSFGVVLYEMLSGKAPFESPTPEGYIGKHLHASPAPLDVSGLPKTVGPGLAAAVMRVLEKKRDRRYPDARAFSEALAALLRSARAAGQSEPPVAATSLRPRAPRAWLAAVVLVAAALAGTFLALRRPTRRAAAPVRKPAVAAPARAAAEVPVRPSDAAGTSEPVAAAPAEPTLPSPAEARQLLERWQVRPNEARARSAAEIARMANRFAADNPGDPLAEEIRQRLPDTLRAETVAALDGGEGSLAQLYFQAYSELSFAPGVPDLAERIGRLPTPPGAARRPRGPGE